MEKTTEKLRIATRKSPLALWQAEHVRMRLEQIHPGIGIELVTMTTQGDRILDSPLAKIGGKGLFVKELEQGLLDGYADIAVHSMKDVPVELPGGLGIVAILEREDPQDAFVSNTHAGIDALPRGACVGTSSLRRQCQLRAARPDLDIHDLRGNVGTRLAKLDNGDYDAIVLACAGLRRLGMAERITAAIPVTQMLPAIGQGIIGIEARLGDERVRELLAPLDDAGTARRLAAERSLNASLAGGCQAPVAGYAILEDGHIELRGLVGWPDGRDVVSGHVSGPAAAAERLGRELAEDLLARGARPILEALLGGA